ncbi:MAG TPA: hypothetical protein VNN80_04945, partial [Polyangiaceae bacterium]|nr:hypothetical protein [Polyangiaceae bacterium]
LNPKPNAGNNSSVMHTSNGWTLQVRKTGSNRDINTSLKTVNVTLNSAHYSAFCGAFQGNSGTKSATVNYTGSIVNSLGWDSTIITLPDP